MDNGVIFYAYQFIKHREELRVLLRNGKVAIHLDWKRSPWDENDPEDGFVYWVYPLKDINKSDLQAFYE